MNETKQKSARVRRDSIDLIRTLRDQMELLTNACVRYDQGSDAEAQNIAVRLRVLLHDTRTSHSLLGQLGVKERLPFVDTRLREMPPEVPRMSGGLCSIQAELGPDGGGSRYVPSLDLDDPERSHPPQAFVDWWESSLVTSNTGEPVNRKDFVLWLANGGGGAHVDPDLVETHADLTASGLSEFQPMPAADGRGRDLVAPTVRQIGFELEHTLMNGLQLDPDRVTLRQPICPLPISADVRVGRNDPCPCGSGVKAKRCFMQRRPIRRYSLGELMQQMDSAA